MNDRRFQYARDLVIGVADGAVITFTVTCGLFGAAQPENLILNAGLVCSVTGALMFGFSRSSTERTAQREEAQNQEELSNKLAQRLDLGDQFAQEARLEMDKDAAEWDARVSNDPSLKQSPSLTAIIIGLGFLIGALLTFLAFIWHPSAEAITISSILFVMLMLVAGAAKSYLSGRNMLSGAIIQLISGIVAAALSFGLGRVLA